MILAFADVELDLDRYELRRAGEPVQVEPQVFDVLVHLAQNAERVVPKEELLDVVWGDRFVSESALTSRIKSARRSVGDDGQRQQVIATAHGRGYRLVAPVATRQRPGERSDGARASPGALLERDALLGQLITGVEAAATGSGRVFCVTGEAGLGKTALVEQLTDEVDGRATVLIGASDDLTTPRSLGPIRDIVDQLPHELSDTLPAEPRGEDVLGVLQHLATATAGPAVVVLEDLHWADDATLDVARFLARRIRTAPVVLVLTYRDEGAAMSAPLRQMLGSLRGPEVARLVLEPLSREAVAVLAEGSAHDAAEVFRATAGNPLFVAEVVAAPPGTVPQSVRDAVLARCVALTDAEAAALCRLAVVPGRLERWLGLQLVERAEQAWLAAERLGLLDGDAHHTWFRHELVRQALEATLTPSERTQAHRAVAGLLQAHDGEPSRIVHHASLGGDVELVLAVGPVAATAAERTGAHRQVAQHLGTVLQHAERLDASTRAELLTRRAHALYLANRFEESLRCAEEAVAIAEPLGNADLLARALLSLGRTILWAKGPTVAAAVERRALDLLGDDGDPELRAIAHADLARALGELVTISSVAQGSALAVGHAARSLALAEQLDRPDLRGYALMYRGSERLAVGDPAGATEIDEAVALLSSLPRTDVAVRSCVNASGAMFRSGRFDEAERYVELGFRLGRDTEFFSGEYRLALTRACVRASTGRWPEAIAELQALLVLEGEPGIMAPLARTLLARLLARQGLAATAAEVLRPAVEVASAAEIRVLGPVTIARVESSWLADDDQDLARLAEPVLGLAAMTSSTVIQAELTRYLQLAGCSPPAMSSAPEPWASGLSGDWRSGARRWSERGEPYEQALELVSADDPAAVARGHDLLRSLGALGTLAAVGRART